MGARIDTDYLVVGAGAGGMAIADELLTHTDGDITIVDRRWAPGGHWLIAYPFVRLHQPSAYYGVSSTPLGQDTIDRHGLNAGFYERAGPDEICAYYRRVMEERFLPSGRVRWLPSHAWDGTDEVVSRLTGASTRIVARRRIVDTTYLEGEFPATSPPPFEVGGEVSWVPVGGLCDLSDTPDRYVVIGAGKTALDAIVHLLERGVEPDRIRWIKPREGRWMNRRHQQPFELLPELVASGAAMMEAFAMAETADDAFDRLESEGIFLRVDPDVPATFLRAAIVSEAELELLRRVDDVVRMGHVRRIERDRVVLDAGDVETSPDALHVHCAARGLARRPLRPVFEGHRLTVQPTMFSPGCFQFALLGAVEAMVDDDAGRNRICRPIIDWRTDAEFLVAFRNRMSVDVAAASHPTLRSWMRSTRLNATSAVGDHVDDPAVADARARTRAHAPAAYENLERLIASAA